jgi:signal transduction histidine kinase
MQLLEDFRATSAIVLDEEESLDRTRMDALRQSTNIATRTALIGGFAVLATTLSLAVVFFHWLLKRLELLRDNAARFAEGDELRSPLQGSDEIAVVDRAFRDMVEKLNVQMQDNDLFVYSVSHDLRSPLVNLQGFSEELSRSCDELESLFDRGDVPAGVRDRGRKILAGSIEESVHYIQTAVGRLARIIDGLLRLSRAGRVVYEPQVADVRLIVTRIVDSLRDSITAKGADVSVGELPAAWGDPAAIEKIFANLITNAVQYLESDRPGRIEVGAVEPGGDHLAVYFVKDNGKGIPDQYHKRVFAPFNRFSPDAAQGEGVGLALVARVAHRQGGRIWMESTAGVGSTFFVSLPPGVSRVERQIASEPVPREA